jgi:hypothetical protein
MLAIVGLHPIDLVGQRALDIGFEGVAQIRWAEQPVHFDNKLAHARTISVPKRADFELTAAHRFSRAI